MYCNKCGNDTNFRTNKTARVVSCRNPACNNILRNKNNFDFRGVDEVNWFAHQMLQKLNTQKNQAKPDWSRMPPGQLLMLLKGEVRELETEMIRQANSKIDDPLALLSECCDVANFAMMIADVICITKHRAYMGD